jgi:molybdate transport system substrate-binding protein
VTDLKKIEFSWARVAVLLLLVASLVLVACGDEDDDPTAAAPPATATTAAAATESTATVAEDPTAASTATTAAEPTAAQATPTSESTEVALEGELTIFAAASLDDVFTEVQNLLQEENPDLTITFNFASSPALANQLIEGAPADVFASANNAQMTVVGDAGLIEGEPELFTRNRLVLVVPVDNPAGIESPADLANEGVQIVTTTPDVPVGQYTLEALDNMTASGEFGDDFRTRVEANFVSLEDNVNAVATKVRLGEADAGIVYLTDITAEVAPDVQVFEIPEEYNVIAEYPIALVAGGNGELGQAFIDFILSDEGQEILANASFTPLPE